MAYNLKEFLKWSSRMAGKPLAFIIAWFLIILWLILGYNYGFTETWILVLNTVATVNASLMVFIIQNTQNRETKALHIKIDGILMSLEKAKQELIAIEMLEEEQLEDIRDGMLKNKGNNNKK